MSPDEVVGVLMAYGGVLALLGYYSRGTTTEEHDDHATR